MNEEETRDENVEERPKAKVDRGALLIAAGLILGLVLLIALNMN